MSVAVAVSETLLKNVVSEEMESVAVAVSSTEACTKFTAIAEKGAAENEYAPSIRAPTRLSQMGL